jgi:hypothetical protein
MKRLFPSLFVVVCLASGCAGPVPQGGAAEAATAEPTSGAPAGPPQPLDLGPVVRGTAPDHDYTDEQIARGAALVTFGGCNDCHTPWVFDPEIGGFAPDMERMLSGHPQGAPGPYGTPDPRDTAIIGPTFTSFALPFGVTYSMNLTPDIDTGTGSWTEEMFLSIFRDVRHMGGDGRTIMPPMPWPSVASLPDEDIVAIFAYLRSIPPVRNAVPSVTVPQEMIDAIGEANRAFVERLEAQRQQ